MGKSKKKGRDQPKRHWREAWRRDCTSFCGWTQASSGNFVEVMITGWMLLMALVLGFVVQRGGQPETQIVSIWLMVSVFLVAAAGLMIHMMFAWAKWERQTAKISKQKRSARKLEVDEPTIRFRREAQGPQDTHE